MNDFDEYEDYDFDFSELDLNNLNPVFGCSLFVAIIAFFVIGLISTILYFVYV